MTDKFEWGQADPEFDSLVKELSSYRKKRTYYLEMLSQLDKNIKVVSAQILTMVSEDASNEE